MIRDMFLKTSIHSVVRLITNKDKLVINKFLHSLVYSVNMYPEITA